jgi:holliday junction DNA helicase RuvA
MIGYLKGQYKIRNTDGIIVDVHGVGYQVALPLSTLTKLTPGQEVELYIYTHVREDVLDLYGFPTQEELALFKLLLGVSGVGPKTALLVMSKGVDLVQKAIVKADTGFFTMIPRLGTKNAQKIIIELKNKMGGLVDLDLSDGGDESNEIIEALMSMGYTKPEAIKAVRSLPDTITKVEEKIRYILKSSSKK